jgi:hypothetical protein
MLQLHYLAAHTAAYLFMLRSNALTPGPSPDRCRWAEGEADHPSP